MKHKKENVIKKIEENKIIAILRGIPTDKLISVAEALYNGGIRLLEVTYSTDGSISDKETAESIKKLCLHFKERMDIGAGTVLTEKQVRLTKKAGAKFIISPNVKKSVIKESIKCGLVSIPGALTPTEITEAYNYGADFVKLFPITNLASGYVKAVKAPLPNIRLLAVGGIDEKNISEYLQSGVVGVGIGSNITPKNSILKEDYTTIINLAKSYCEAVKNG